MCETWKIKTLGRADGGKLTDSQDSFKFSYVEIHPGQENFSLSASFLVEDAGSADYHSGYGIMAVDTVSSSSHLSRFRNSLMVGRFRSNSWRNFSCGLRVVSGYSDREALSQGGRRKLDCSRLFSSGDNRPLISAGDKHLFRLEKTDEGFRASMMTDSGWETIEFPGCDFLLRQDRKYMKSIIYWCYRCKNW